MGEIIHTGEETKTKNQIMQHYSVSELYKFIAFDY